jgi:hypothetical protein
LGLGKLYIHCLEQEGFLTKPRQEQWDIINAFHQKENITPSNSAQEGIDTALSMLEHRDERKYYFQLVEPYFWTTFVRKVQEEIEIQKLAPSSQTS